MPNELFTVRYKLSLTGVIQSLFIGLHLTHWFLALLYRKRNSSHTKRVLSAVNGHSISSAPWKHHRKGLLQTTNHPLSLSSANLVNDGLKMNRVQHKDTIIDCNWCPRPIPSSFTWCSASLTELDTKRATHVPYPRRAWLLMKSTWTVFGTKLALLREIDAPD